MVVPGIRRNLFSVMAAANDGILTIFNYQNPGLEGFGIPAPIRSESGDPYSIMLYLSADGYRARELAMNVGVNAQVWHWWPGHLHAQHLLLGYGDPIGSFTPVVIGGYKYVSKVTDEFTKWTAVYFLTSKNQALLSLQLLIGSTVIHFGGCIVCWRAEKGGEYTG